MRGFVATLWKFRWGVVALWALLLVLGGIAAPTTTDRLTFDFSTPGEPGNETAKQIAQTYQTDSADAPFLLVLRSQDGTALDEAAVGQAFSAVKQEVPEARIIDKRAANGNPIFSTADGSAQFAYAYGPPAAGFEYAHRDVLLESLQANAPAGTDPLITGINELANNSADESSPAVLVETVIAGLAALVVLAFVFASLLALVPLVIAAVSILSTFLILLGVTYLTDVSFIVQYLIALVGLGVAIDYSLLLVTRWREERTAGRTNEEAVEAAVATAGRAVVFSGITVAVGLLALVLLPVPFLRSIGIGGLLIPLVSVAAVLTLLPVLLRWIGPRIDRPQLRKEPSESKFWLRWATFVSRRPVLTASFGGLLLVALLVPVSLMNVGNAGSSSLATRGPAVEALAELNSGGVPSGVLTPVEVLTDRASAAQTLRATDAVDGVQTAFITNGTSGFQGDSALVMAIPQKETVDSSSLEVVRQIKDATDPIVGVVGTTGLGALQIDYENGVYGNAPLAVGLIMLITYILLVRAFRSLLLPLKAVILNLVSLAATFGVITLFWQEGFGSDLIFGVSATGAVTFWIPVMIFAFLYGLSMDYEVFILARMREEWDATKDTSTAVIRGTARTGRLVTSAALILFLAFVSLASAPQTEIKMLATALGVGILLDATVVRMLLVPALVVLFDKYNWYLPANVARLLRVEPSPLVSSSAKQDRVPSGPEPAST